MVTVLMVPLMLGSTAGSATSVNAALCAAGNGLPSTNVGAINARTESGVTGPGVFLARRLRQRLVVAAGSQACVPPSVGPLLVTHAKVSATLQTSAAVNCSDLKAGARVLGTGKFTWTAPSGMGWSFASIEWRWTGYRTIHFWGTVIPAQAGAGGNVFKGDHVSGYILTKESLAPKASGGDCVATTFPLTHWTINAIVYELRP